MSYPAQRLAHALADIETGLKNLERVRDAQTAVESEIRDDRTITEDLKRLEIAEARRRASARIEQIVGQIEQAKADAAKAVDDGWRSRTISGEARTQVGRLLDQGLSPGDILGTARRVRDPEVALALRAEVPWRKSGDVSLDTPEVLEAVDDVLAEVGLSPEKDLAQGSRRLRALSEVADHSAKLSFKEAAGKPSPQDRIALGYAQNEAQETA